jgi:hypothetical protein
VSLLAPSTPGYDPWAWLVWGREIVSLDLDTTAGPAWKPLPVLVTSALAPLGDATPELWLVIGRAAGLLALALAGRIAFRLAGGGRPGLAGAAVAAGCLLVVTGFARGAAIGNAEALAIAAGLAAFDRHLDRAYRHTFVLGVAVALLRPEAWPLLAAYGVWLLRRDGERRLVLAAAVAVPALWFLPDLWGSGELLRSSERAQIPNPGAPTLGDHPALESAKAFGLMVPPPVWAGVALAVAVVRHHIARALAGAAAAWVVLVAAMAELGFSGEQRYQLPAAAAACALAGAGWSRALASRPRPAVLVLAVFAAATVPFAAFEVPRLARDLSDDARLRAGLAKALSENGAAELRRCGAIAAGRYRFPLVAWHLDVPISRISLAPSVRGVVLRSRLRRDGPIEPPRPGGGYQRMTAVAGWEIWTDCDPS